MDFFVLENNITSSEFFRQLYFLRSDHALMKIDDVPLPMDENKKIGGCGVDLRFFGLPGQRDFSEIPAGVVKQVKPFIEIIEIHLIFVIEQLVHTQPANVTAQIACTGDQLELRGVWFRSEEVRVGEG